MKKLLLLFFVFSLACSSPKMSEKEIVTVSILPQKFFVEKIAGDMLDVQVLVPPGASPATYSLLPSQMRSLSRSLAWLRIGKIGFEEAWHDKIEEGNPNLKVFDTSVSANWIAGEEEQHGDHIHLHGIDPHIWMSPDEVLRIAEHSLHALIELFPKHKALFLERFEVFKNEIKLLDQELQNKFDGLKERKFLIFHPSLSYFARQYQLEQIAMEVDGKEPSPKYLMEVVCRARESQIKVVFIQKEFDQENAQQLANEIQGKVVQLDPLNENWNAQLRKIADKIVGASK